MKSPILIKRIIILSSLLLFILALSVFLGLSTGSSGSDLKVLFRILAQKQEADPMMKAIVWRIRLPRVLLAIQVGAALSLGGLVFQALLRNPLAEPYILGISGGSAVGAIIGILMGFSRFPGVSLTAFAGSTATLFLILFISSGESILRKDSLLLSGVMVNAFCSSVIMFFISLTQDSRLHNILFWIMGDLSIADTSQVLTLFCILVPCFILILLLTHTMNLLLMGKEMAMSMGINVKAVTFTLLITTSFMVSATVCHSGLLGFVGLVMPHLLRLLYGPDHRILAPACILAGGAYMVLCDLLARWIPEQGEMPVGVITAMIGAPLFIYLLRKTSK
ncbi:MAG: iron ABC transporter permease [Desulfobacterales bacterium]|nr:iron ABC transporter permease [Desulfobacterales bacterium]